MRQCCASQGQTICGSSKIDRATSSSSKNRWAIHLSHLTLETRFAIWQCRCLHTATVTLAGIKPNATNVEEFVRETLGEDTCDARRSVSDPNHAANRAVDPEEPCSFDKGLETLYAQYKYKVYDPRAGKQRGLGLLGDSDHLWTKDKREAQKHQVRSEHIIV